jgi:hypothetical protein
VTDQVDVTTKRLSSAATSTGKAAAKRGSELGAEAAVLGKAAATKGEQALERAIEVSLEHGSDALLTALSSEPGKRLAATAPGAALKSKLTGRRRSRKKILLVVLVNAGVIVVLQQVRRRRAAASAAEPTSTTQPTPTETA